MTLIKTSLLNAIAVIIKMLTLLSINKILAIYVGPAGYASLGQFQNAVQMITTFASGAINAGVTKYTAEYHADSVKQQAVWQTAGTISLLGSTISAFFIIMFNEQLAILFLGSANYSGVFVWFSATLLFLTFNTLLLAILNGKKEVARYVIANIFGSLFSLVITSVLAISFGLYGALIALAVYQSLSFFITFIICIRADWFQIKYLFGEIDKGIALKLSRYTAMAITSAACVPISHILVRDHLVNNLGWESAGYWEAMWRLSAAYLMLVTTTLSVYYLPRLSELKDSATIKKEIFSGYKVILPAAAISGFFIYIFRDFFIGVLFTQDFSPMRNLFGWQMIGDTLKIGSWLLAYLMLSKAMMKEFIATEIFFSVTFYALTKILTQKIGLEGVTLAYAINYFFYWGVIALLVSMRLRKSTFS